MSRVWSDVSYQPNISTIVSEATRSYNQNHNVFLNLTKFPARLLDSHIVSPNGKKKENKRIQLTLCQLIIRFQKFSRFVSEPRNSQLAVCWIQSHFFALLWLADS